MTDTELKRQEAICEVAGVDDIGELSDGFHTFNSLYEQRMILFAALVKAYKDRAWKSYRHEDGEYCFGGGWFIVGIDTPEGGYTYHYENKYWDMFDCIDLPRGKHWDGHTEADADTRLMSLEPEQRWIPCSERLPEFGHVINPDPEEDSGWDESPFVLVCFDDGDIECRQFIREDGMVSIYPEEFRGRKATAWMPLPEPYAEEST